MPESSGLKVQISELIDCLADTIDLVSPELADHHHKVGYLASALGRAAGLSEESCLELLFAGKLHDIGALSLAERQRLMNFEVDETLQHAEMGALLLETFPPLAPIARILRFHHLRWKEHAEISEREEPVPLGSHIVHLADRIAVLVNGTRGIPLLAKAREIRAQVEQESRGMFAPELVDAFRSLAQKESFWLGLEFPQRRHETEPVQETGLTLDTDEVIGLSTMFARIIDFRSRFTATHSRGVAACVAALAELADVPETERLELRLAGLLHDIGKFAVSTELLEKPGPLTLRERAVIRCHPFFTRRALQRVASFQAIAEWGSNHHERLDCSGYPNHTGGSDLSLGSRIVAVADVFTAIAEDRPYRAGMDRAHVTRTIERQVARQALDRDVAALLLEHYDEVNAARIAAQGEAAREYGEICCKVEALAA